MSTRPEFALVVADFFGCWTASGQALRTNLAVACSANVAYADPVLRAVGIDELAAHIEGTTATYATAVRLISGVDSHHTWARARWAAFRNVSDQVLMGESFLEWDPRDDKIINIVSFIGAVPPRTVTFAVDSSRGDAREG